MNRYILSVIIPTRNRQKYCLYAVKQILSHKWDNVEICIQDNSDNNSLKDDLTAIGNNNVVYNYHAGELSFVDNFSEAVSLAHGEFLCMIGDDDGILPNIMHAINDMIEQKADAAIPELNCIYFWPSNQNIIENGDTGVLVINSPHGESLSSGRSVNHLEAFKNLLKNGIQNYTSLEIPRLYHGIVRRGVLNSIKETAGNYFGGLTPDIYMATALTLTCKKVIRIDYSITISGICPTSGSSDSATGRHTGELSIAPHFRGHTDYKWEDLVPAFYSVDTIWADTLFHALRDFGREDLIEHYDHALFTSICIKKYPDYKQLLLNHSIKNGCTTNSVRIASIKYKIKAFAKRIKGWTRRLLSFEINKSTIKKYQIKDIMEAEAEIEKMRR